MFTTMISKKILQLTLKLKQCRQLLKNSICETKDGELFLENMGKIKKDNQYLFINLPIKVNLGT